jgi:hypothetical protein
MSNSTQQQKESSSEYTSVDELVSKFKVFYLEMVLRMIVKNLRRREPYDKVLRTTDRVTMPRYVFDKLFGSLNNYTERKIYCSDKERQKEITTVQEFENIFNLKLPQKMFKAPVRISRLRLPLILFYCDKGLSGCGAILQFNVLSSKKKKLNEMRSLKKGESKTHAYTKKAYEQQQKQQSMVQQQQQLTVNTVPATTATVIPKIRRRRKPKSNVTQVSATIATTATTIVNVQQQQQHIVTAVPATTATVTPKIRRRRKPKSNVTQVAATIATTAATDSVPNQLSTPPASRTKRMKTTPTPPSASRVSKRLRYNPPSPEERSRSQRQRRLPDYLQDYILN